MSDQSQIDEFVTSLSRVRSTATLSEDDQMRVAQLLVDKRRGRREERIRRGAAPKLEVFLQELAIHDTKEQGLSSLGWKEIPIPQHAKGAFGTIWLAHSTRETNVPLKRRHICAAKIQPAMKHPVVWNELEIMKGLVHPNVVSFFGAFGVRPAKDARDTYGNPVGVSVFILMEYANAKDMEKEMDRFAAGYIPESGALYYMHQVCAGMAYIHKKGIIHRDLHNRNVLLRYNPDLSKTCLICDFGRSLVLENMEYAITPPRSVFQDDVANICKMAANVTGCFNENRKETSVGADQVYTIARRYVHGFPDEIPFEEIPLTVNDLLQYQWFQSTGVAPIPKPATPLLEHKVVKQIGFKEQEHASGASIDLPLKASLLQRARRGITSLPDIIASPFRRSPRSPRVRAESFTPKGFDVIDTEELARSPAHLKSPQKSTSADAPASPSAGGSRSRTRDSGRREQRISESSSSSSSSPTSRNERRSQRRRSPN